MKDTRRSSQISVTLWGIIIIYIVIMSTITINRHYTFRTAAYDLGIFVQSIWSTISKHGILYNTIEEFAVCTNTHFGVHFSPILLFLVPIYAIFPYVETLLIIQTIVIGISAYPLYLLSKELLKSEKISLVLVILYLGNSLLHGINGYDFHEAPFAMPFIFLTAFYIEKEEYKKAILSSIFILITKEDAGIVLISLGAFYLMKEEDLLNFRIYIKLLKGKNMNTCKRFSIFLVIIGLLWTILTTLVIIPSISGGFSVDKVFYSGFPCLNFLPRKIFYFLTASLTLGFLPFLKPKYAILLTSLPWLEILATCQINMFRIGFQYPYMLLPLSMITSMYALRESSKEEIKKLLAMGVTIGLVTSILTSPILPLTNPIKKSLLVPPLYHQTVTDHHKKLMETTELLSETNFSILTQNDIFPHLANRKETYVIWSSYCGKKLPNADIILLDWKLLYSMYNYFVKNHSKDYIKIYENDGIEIWIRKEKSNDLKISKLKK